MSEHTIGGHVSVERMNESLDGALSAAENEPLLRHLEGCGPCRNEYARFSETIEAVRALPKGATPPAEAWLGIAARIAATPQSASDAAEGVAVYKLPTSERRGPRRISLSIPQLAAAAVFVAFCGAGLLWLAISGGQATVSPGIADLGDPVGGAAARAISLEGPRYADVVTQLERVLAEGRAFLAPETLESIEESLITVDAAIAEIEAALAQDPGSDLLMRLLATHQRTKLGVLQRAAAAVQSRI